MSFFPKRPVPGASYLLRRLEAEIALAERAEDERAGEIHHRLASVYLGKVFGDEQPGPASEQASIRRERRAAVVEVLKHFSETLDRDLAETGPGEFDELLSKLDAG